MFTLLVVTYRIPLKLKNCFKKCQQNVQNKRKVKVKASKLKEMEAGSIISAL